MADNIGGFKMGGLALNLVWLYFEDSDLTQLLEPLTDSITAKLTGPLIIWVSGAKSFHLVTPGYAAFNPYLAVLHPNGTTSVFCMRC
jgi:hypothetical protein